MSVLDGFRESIQQITTKVDEVADRLSQLERSVAEMHTQLSKTTTAQPTTTSQGNASQGTSTTTSSSTTAKKAPSK